MNLWFRFLKRRENFSFEKKTVFWFFNCFCWKIKRCVKSNCFRKMCQFGQTCNFSKKNNFRWKHWTISYWHHGHFWLDPILIEVSESLFINLDENLIKPLNCHHWGSIANSTLRWRKAVYMSLNYCLSLLAGIITCTQFIFWRLI